MSSGIAKELLSLDYYSNLVGQFSLSNVWVQMEPWKKAFFGGMFESSIDHGVICLVYSCTSNGSCMLILHIFACIGFDIVCVLGDTMD